MKKSAFALIFSVIFLTFIPVTANAAIPSTCDFKPVFTPPNLNADTFSQWITRNKTYFKSVNKTNCFNDMQAVRDLYDKRLSVFQANQVANTQNTFSARFKACTGNQNGISLSPSQWGNNLVCAFTVSFVPSSQVIKDSFIQMKTDITTHQPTSYIPVALGTINNLKDNWGSINCSTGALQAEVKLQNSAGTLNFVIPCKPPSALEPFRKLMVLGVYLSLAFWIYFIGIRFWKEMQT